MQTKCNARRFFFLAKKRKIFFWCFSNVNGLPHFSLFAFVSAVPLTLFLMFGHWILGTINQYVYCNYYYYLLYEYLVVVVVVRIRAWSGLVSFCLGLGSGSGSGSGSGLGLIWSISGFRFLDLGFYMRAEAELID
jgi:hypothetical protein